MARREGLFARLSLDYADHPKIAVLSDEAFRAHVEMILYSRKYMTDGQIAKQIAKRWPQQALNELLANDSEAPSLLELDSGDYLLHGLADMQETKQEIEAKRQVRAEAGRKGGRAKKQNSKPMPSKTPGKQSSNLLSKNVAETESETETEVSNRPPVSPRQGTPTNPPPPAARLGSPTTGHQTNRTKRKQLNSGSTSTLRRRTSETTPSPTAKRSSTGHADSTPG